MRSKSVAAAMVVAAAAIAAPAPAETLERVEVAIGSGDHSEDLEVTFRTERPTLSTGDVSKVFISFPSPAQTDNQRLTIGLFEHGGSRHVRLEDVSL